MMQDLEHGGESNEKPLALPNPRPGCEDSLRCVSRWLNYCRNNHTKCRGAQSQFVPSYLIQIQRDPGWTLKLLEMKYQACVPYAALSYCWGSGDNYVTTRATLPAHMDHLDFSALPRSIQDAVITCHSLGLHYLWVDALCIVQDDDERKGEEISKMDEVYSEATITICASRAEDVHQGFLFDRGVRVFSTRVVTTSSDRPNENSKPGFLVSGKLSNWTEPLDLRSWALQERLLSRRVLSFGKVGTRWHCPEIEPHRSVNDGVNPAESRVRLGLQPGALWTDMSELAANAYSSLLILNRTTGPGGTPREDADRREANLRMWRVIVEASTQRQLTRSSDRLPTVSAIARRFASIFKDTYCAGLWWSSISAELLWHCERVGKDKFFLPFEECLEQEGGNLTRITLPPFPSWSWASVDGSVELSGIVGSQYQDRGLVADESFAATDINLKHAAGHDRFGITQFGRLTLRGRLGEAEWSPVGGNIHTRITFPDSHPLAAHGQLAAMVNADCRPTQYPTKDGKMAVSLLLVAWCGRCPKQHCIRCIKPSGLMLTKLPTGEYFRIGTWEFADFMTAASKLYKGTDDDPKLFMEHVDWIRNLPVGTVTII